MSAQRFHLTIENGSRTFRDIWPVEVENGTIKIEDVNYGLAYGRQFVLDIADAMFGEDAAIDDTKAAALQQAVDKYHEQWKTAVNLGQAAGVMTGDFGSFFWTLIF